MAEQRYRLKVIEDRCQGHNRCRLTAPTLFQVDKFGNAQAVGDGTVPPDMLEKAKLAVANCPEYAIELVRE